MEDYWAVRQGAGLIVQPLWGVIELRGSDRASFLHNLLTNDIKRLAAGSSCQAALVTPSAKLLADLVVLAEADAHWLIMPRARVETVLKTLDRYLITEAVTLEDRSGTHAILALQGPRSAAILQTLTGVRQAAYSLTGEPGVLLIVPSEHAPVVSAHARAQGARLVSQGTLDVLRIEAGVPWFGVDMDETNLLPETGLEARAVSSTKGCYLGQEVIARLQTYGSVSRKLMGLIGEGQVVLRAGDPIGKEAEELGTITSACFSPALSKPIALGYVKRPSYEAGTRVVVRRDGRDIPATLMTPPFV